MNLFNLITIKRTTKLSALLIALFFSHSLFAGQGYATRYWDGCKPHCSWDENSPGNPVKTCNIANQVNPITGEEIASSCDGGEDGAYTCWDMVPKRISDTLSYGYAAVPATGDICGVCYELTFTGTGKYSDTEPGSMALKAKQKKMIVMATNIGHDVAGGQFDVLIPGGGVGAFNACSTQWQVSNEELGAQYGGFLTACQQDLNTWSDIDALKSCVQNSCDTVFSKPGMEDLKAGCDWYVDWYEMADNPNLEYEVVACPAALMTGAYDVDPDSNNTQTQTQTETETETEIDLNTAPTIQSAVLSNGFFMAQALDAQTASSELIFNWTIDNTIVAIGATAAAPTSITGSKIVTLSVSDGELTTVKVFAADFGSNPTNTETETESNTAPTIQSAALLNGYFIADASDAQTASSELVFSWTVENIIVALGETVTAPSSITGTKVVTLTVSDGALSTKYYFSADFGEPTPTATETDTSGTENPQPETPIVENNQTSNSASSDATSSGSIGWIELFALFGFGWVFISKRRFI